MSLPRKDKSDNEMTKEFIEEEKTQQTVDNIEKQKSMDENIVVFWSRAKEHRVGNWIPEIKGRESGTIIQREQPLRFYAHILSTDDEKKINFVRESHGFINGDVVECKNMQEARALTLQQNQRKQVKHEVGQDVESTLVEIK